MSELKDSIAELSDVQASYRADLPDTELVRELHRLSQLHQQLHAFDDLDHFIIGMNSWDSGWLKQTTINAWHADDCRAIKSDWAVVGRDLTRALASALADGPRQTQTRIWEVLLKAAQKTDTEKESSGQMQLPIGAPTSHG